jgi:hypothetical protein
MAMSPSRHLVWRRGYAVLVILAHAILGWFGGMSVLGLWIRSDRTDGQAIGIATGFAASLGVWVAAFRWVVVPTCPRCRRRVAWRPERRVWGERGFRMAQVRYHYQCPGCGWSEVLEATAPESQQYRGPGDNESACGGG